MASCFRLQAEAGRGASPRANDTITLGGAEEVGDRIERYVSNLSEDQVRRRRRPHLQLLRHPVLRTLRRKGHSTVEQGKGVRKRSLLRLRAGRSRGQIDRIVTNARPLIRPLFRQFFLPLHYRTR